MPQSRSGEGSNLLPLLGIEPRNFDLLAHQRSHYSEGGSPASRCATDGYLPFFLSFSVYPSIYLSVCPSVRPSVCLHSYLSVFISIHLSIQPYIYLMYISVYLSVPASVRPLSVYPSVLHQYVRPSVLHLYVRLFVHPPVRPSVCLPFFFFSCHYVSAICLEFFFIIPLKYEGSSVCNAACFSIFPVTSRLQHCAPCHNSFTCVNIELGCVCVCLCVSRVNIHSPSTFNFLAKPTPSSSPTFPVSNTKDRKSLRSARYHRCLFHRTLSSSYRPSIMYVYMASTKKTGLVFRVDLPHFGTSSYTGARRFRCATNCVPYIKQTFPHHEDARV